MSFWFFATCSRCLYDKLYHLCFIDAYHFNPWQLSYKLNWEAKMRYLMRYCKKLGGRKSKYSIVLVALLQEGKGSLWLLCFSLTVELLHIFSFVEMQFLSLVHIFCDLFTPSLFCSMYYSLHILECMLSLSRLPLALCSIFIKTMLIFCDQIWIILLFQGGKFR